MRGHWNPCFSRHFNDWELDIIKTFFFRSLVKLVRRGEQWGRLGGFYEGHVLNLIFLFSLGTQEVNPLSNGHHLESREPVQSELFLLGKPIGEKFGPHINSKTKGGH